MNLRASHFLFTLALASATCPALSQQVKPEKSSTSQGDVNANQAPLHDIYGDVLPDGAVARLGTIRYRHPGWYKKGFTVPGTHEFVLGTKDNTVRFWNVETGRLLREIPRIFGYFSCFAVTMDGRHVVTVHSDTDNNTRISKYQINFWDGTTCKRIRKPIMFETSVIDGVTVIAITGDAATIAGATRRGTIRFWDTASGTEILQYRLSDREIKAMTFSPDGEQLAIGSRNQVAIWNWITGEDPKFLETKRGTLSITYSSDGKLLATGSDEELGIRLWNADTGDLIWRIEESKGSYYPEGIQFSTDDKFLVAPVAHNGKRIDLMDVKTGKTIRSFSAEPIKMRVAGISTEKDLVCGVGSDSAIFAWRLSTGEPFHDRFAGHLETPYEIDVFPDDTAIITACMDGTVRIWDAKTGAQNQLFRHNSQWVTGAALSPDLTKLATIGFDDRVCVWNVATGDLIREFKGHGRQGGFQHYEVEFSKDANSVYSFGRDLFLKQHDISSGKTTSSVKLAPTGVKEVPNEQDPFGDMAETISEAQFSRNTNRLVILSQGSIFLFDAATGKELLHEKPKQRPTGVQFFRDGTHLATLHEKLVQTEGLRSTRVYELKIRDADSLKVKATHAFKSGYSHRFAISPDNQHLAIVDYDNDQRSWSAHVFDIHTWQLLFKTPAWTNAIHAMSFSADGKRLVTSMSGSSVLVWDLNRLRVVVE